MQFFNNLFQKLATLCLALTLSLFAEKPFYGLRAGDQEFGIFAPQSLSSTTKIFSNYCEDDKKNYITYIVPSENFGAIKLLIEKDKKTNKANWKATCCIKKEEFYGEGADGFFYLFNPQKTKHLCFGIFRKRDQFKDLLTAESIDWLAMFSKPLDDQLKKREQIEMENIKAKALCDKKTTLSTELFASQDKSCVKFFANIDIQKNIKYAEIFSESGQNDLLKEVSMNFVSKDFTTTINVAKYQDNIYCETGDLCNFKKPALCPTTKMFSIIGTAFRRSCEKNKIKIEESPKGSLSSTAKYNKSDYKECLNVCLSENCDKDTALNFLNEFRCTNNIMSYSLIKEAIDEYFKPVEVEVFFKFYQWSEADKIYQSLTMKEVQEYYQNNKKTLEQS